MWYGTVHMAHGHFPQPAFWGQDYGSMLEAVLAIPLYLCGWPLNYALPFVTCIWGLTPFFFSGIYCLKRNNYIGIILTAEYYRL